LVNFGVDAQLCQGFKFKLKLDKVDNEKTEDLTTDQLRSLLKAIDQDTHPYAGKLMKLALYTGMRRSEMLRLRWVDIKFEREFIELRNDEGLRHTKGGEIETIPLNKPAASLLESIQRTRSKYIFPGRSGPKKDGRPGPRKEMNRAVNRIKKKAGLPDDFRPLHGLRHFYASNLASSGEVELYTLQKLLTHKDPKTTARYAHLRDRARKKASALAGSIIEEAASNKEDDKKVVSLEDRKK
jgi:integrase